MTIQAKAETGPRIRRLLEIIAAAVKREYAQIEQSGQKMEKRS